MKIAGFVVTGLLAWILIATTLVGNAPAIDEEFSLFRAVPNDVFLCIAEKKMGPDHTGTAATLHTLAILLTDTGDFGGAEPLYQRALAIREQALGAEHPDVAETLEAYAGLLRRVGRRAEADELSARAAASP